MVSRRNRGVLRPRSLDCTGGALVDASSAVDTDIGVDDCDITDGDGGGRACICAYTACDTICFFNCRHFETSETATESTVFKRIGLLASVWTIF